MFEIFSIICLFLVEGRNMDAAPPGIETLIYHLMGPFFPIWRRIITPNGIYLSENFQYCQM